MMHNQTPTQARAGADLRRGWQSLDRTQLALLALVLVRLAVITLFLLNVLPLERRDEVYRWYLQHGGDQETLLALARSILAGAPISTSVSIGQALMMAPWVALLRPAHYMEIVAPLVLVNGYLFGGLSVLLVGDLARTATGDRRAALLAAGLWALLPLFAYFAFFWHFDPVLLRSVTVPKVGWLNGLSDGPAAFFLLLGSVLLARLQREVEPGFWQAAGVGAALGAAVLFRLTVAPAAAFLLLLVWIVAGWRAFLAALGALLVVYLPQAWYNHAVFGFPFTTGYLSIDDVRDFGGTLRRPFGDILARFPASPSLANIGGAVAHFVGRRPWILAPLAAGAAVGLAALVSLWRRLGWRTVLLLVAAPLAYLLPMMMMSNFATDPIRYAMPAMPALLVATCFVLVRMVHRWLPGGEPAG